METLDSTANRRSERAPSRLAVVFVVLLAPACASLSGLSAADHDAGADAHLAGDSGAPIEAALHDGGHDAGVRDATRDSASPRDVTSPRDARRVDAGHDSAAPTGDALPGDAADAETGCGEYFPDASPSSNCAAPPPDACAPQLLPNFHPTWTPPAKPQAACTVKQVENLVAACFGPDASSAACNPILDTASERPCDSCIITYFDAGSWGPVYYTGGMYGYYELNVAGCLAVNAPCQTACAQEYEAWAQCYTAACGSVCPPEGDPLYACWQAADDCVCAAYSSAYQSCYEALTQADPASATCYGALNDFAVGALTLGLQFCTGDGGPDAM